MLKDMHLVRMIVSIWDPSSWLAKKKETVTNIDWTQVKTVMPPKRDRPPGIIYHITKAGSKQTISRKGKDNSVKIRKS